MVRRWITLFSIIALVLLVDQVSKRWVIANLMLGETVQPIPALAPFFQFTRSENTGASFGFLPQAGDLFLIIAIIVTVALVFFYPRVPERARVTRVALGLVCGGAMGNAIDRIDHGAVIDFIHYYIPGIISNVSNLADHAIVIGVLLIFIESWYLDSAHKREAAAVENAPAEGEGQPPL